jgi:hypothetical protein
MKIGFMCSEEAYRSEHEDRLMPIDGSEMGDKVCVYLG